MVRALEYVVEVEELVSGLSRAERLREMERLFVDRAYTDVELAERLGVNRSTVYRDRLELERECPFVEVAPGRWRIDRAGYVSSIRLNLHEALALYLAARRTSRQSRYADRHLVAGLEKLASALQQPMTERLVAAAGAVLAQTADPDGMAVREAIARGWAERRKVRVLYRSLQRRQARWYTRGRT